MTATPDQPDGQRDGVGIGDIGGAGRARPKTNGTAIASLVCGLAQFPLWLLLVPGFISATVALILGLVALRQLRRRPEAGGDYAIAGMILGVLGVALGIAAVVALVIVAPRLSGLIGLTASGLSRR